MVKIGFTEAGDAGIDLSWGDKLQPVNIIISKHLTRLNTSLMSLLLENKDKIIFHCTCTGFGSSAIEPFVPPAHQVYEGVLELIDRGFPAKQIVLRTDPIIPTPKGIKNAETIWKLFANTGIKRCRYSVIDMYKHVQDRFMKEFHTVPFEGFKAPPEMMDAVRKAVEAYSNLYDFECCAEDLPGKTGCVSKKDFDILNIPFDQTEGGYQRKTCACCAGKTELLSNKFRCPSGCLYCYWKDEN